MNSGFINSAASPLAHPERFVRAMWVDGKTSIRFAEKLFRQSIAQQYRYSSLGLLWAVLPSLAIAIGLSMNLNSGTTDSQGAVSVPLQVHAVFGVLMMQTFIETLNAQRITFIKHQNLMQRQRFPFEAVAIAQIAESAFHMLVKLPLLALFLFFFEVPIGISSTLAIFGFGVMLTLGIGLGLSLAPMSRLNNDFDKVMVFLPWLLFLITPIFFRTSSGAALSGVYRLNPLAYLLDLTRYWAYGEGQPDWLAFGLLTIGALVLLVLGLVFCKVSAPRVAEHAASQVLS